MKMDDVFKSSIKLKSDTNEIHCVENLFDTVSVNMDDDQIRLFYDTFLDRYFYSTCAKVMAAEYYCNRTFVLGLPVTLISWCQYLSLPLPDYIDDIELGSRGWYLTDNANYYWIDFFNEKGKVGDNLEVIFVGVSSTTPCIDLSDVEELND